MIVVPVILTGFASLLIYCYWKQTWSPTAKLLNQFPQVGPMTPILGHLNLLSTHPETLFKQIRHFLNKCDRTIGGWGVIFGTIHIKTADDAEIILSNPNYNRKGLIYKALRPWLGTGLLTSRGAKWHHRRKMLTPAFHYNVLKMYVDTFGQQSQILVERLKDEGDKTETNIIPIITDATFSTICETAMGLKIDLNDLRIRRYFEALHGLAQLIIKVLLSSPLLMIPPLRFFSITCWKIQGVINKLHAFSRKVIQKRQETFDESIITNLEVESKTRKNLAMLDLLIYAQRHLGEIDDNGIREEVDTFVFEGHDTTTVGLCYALLLLSHHEDVQQKIIAELDEIFKDSSRQATYEDLQNMRYLERCLKECLRLYPSVPFIVRNVDKDIPLTHHVAPARTDIFIHIYEIHRDPKYYPDPEKFDPDRFLPENSKGRHPFAYIPFSAGPRNCIGQKFAMLELKSFVSSIFRNFTLEAIHSPEDLRWTTDFVLRVNGPINIKFKSR